jgi:putative two-component system response regulator
MNGKLNILMLEDSSAAAELIERELRKAEIRFSTRRVSTKEDFLKSLDDFCPDLILGEYKLPLFDGFAALALAREKCPDAPFVLVSGAINEDLAVEALKRGATDYIFKDNLSRLVPAVVRALIEKEERARRQAAEKGLKQSYERLQKAMDGTIHAIAKIVEAKDPYTAGHERRVSQLTYAAARELGLSEKKTEGIVMASALHDVGKISVPAEILTKTGRLSESEFSIVKSHPTIGFQILKEVEFPWPIAQIVLQHHERLDGSGYPEGITGDKIIPEAKILAVADVVEAMVSHRPYRPAFDVEKALEEISGKKGVLYDPEMVDTCVKLFTERDFKFT